MLLCSHLMSLWVTLPHKLRAKCSLPHLLAAEEATRHTGSVKQEEAAQGGQPLRKLPISQRAASELSLPPEDTVQLTAAYPIKVLGILNHVFSFGTRPSLSFSCSRRA